MPLDCENCKYFQRIIPKSPWKTCKLLSFHPLFGPGECPLFLKKERKKKNEKERLNNMDFQCLRCGYCCRSLFRYCLGFKSSLTLLPSETKHFPRNLIVPKEGIGRKGRSRIRPKRIILFQLNTSVCPHVSKTNECEIYDERPLICRAYPLLLFGMDTVCTSIKLKPYQDPTVEMKVARQKIWDYINTPEFNPFNLLVFDLADMKWKPYPSRMKLIYLKLGGEF